MITQKRIWGVTSFLLILIYVFYCKLPDINNCSVNDLTKIKGIGKVRAEQIIKNRPYHSFGEIEKISKIGKKTVMKLVFRMRIKPMEKSLPDQFNKVWLVLCSTLIVTFNFIFMSELS